MDQLRERFDALEHQVQTLHQQTHAMARRLRWWRGVAGGLLMLGLLSWALPSSKAADPQPGGMADRMVALEKKLTAMTFDEAANEVIITGVNLRIVNGLGTTDTTNGLGNLIVGYNESRQGNHHCPPPVPCIDTRTGSHNVVVGRLQNFSSFGGLVVGELNEISGEFASVSGGFFNTASGVDSSVSGGGQNTASGPGSSVSGGSLNTAANPGGTSVSGGEQNTASGIFSSVCGGVGNTASFQDASVTGGSGNTASGLFSSISGGRVNTASGTNSSVSGGDHNIASGDFSSVSGGLNRTAPAKDNWAAGPLFADF
jgi:hypothetical protein